MLKKLLLTLLASTVLILSACDSNYEPVGYSGNPAYVSVTGNNSILLSDVVTLTGVQTLSNKAILSTSGGSWNTSQGLNFTDVRLTQGWSNTLAVRNLANNDYRDFETRHLYLDGDFKFQTQVNSGFKPADGLAASNYYTFYGHNDTSNTSHPAVARIHGSNTSPFFSFQPHQVLFPYFYHTKFTNTC